MSEVGAKVTVSGRWVQSYSMHFSNVEVLAQEPMFHRKIIYVPEMQEFLDNVGRSHYGVVVITDGPRITGLRMNFADSKVAMLFKLRFGGER